jgi:hypothetical protein
MDSQTRYPEDFDENGRARSAGEFAISLLFAFLLFLLAH